MKVIADHPTDEMYASGLEIDCQCARCGSSVDSEECDACNCEDGCIWDDDDEDAQDWEPCPICDGAGVWHRCMSSPEWCQANPIPGREDVPRGKIEWFTIG